MGKKTLIIGAPRSGTLYISTLFQMLDIDIEHEGLGLNGMVDWEATFWDKEPPYSRNPKSKDILISDFDVVFHQTRNPIPNIESMHIVDKHNISKARACVKQMNEDDSMLLTAMKFYYYYNLKADEEAVYRYRIESIKHSIFSILEVMGYIGDEAKNLYISKIISRSNTSTHTLRDTRPKEKDRPQYGKVTWELMEKEDRELALEIKEMVRNYGYKID